MSMPTIGHIFEIIDVNDEENYYSLGIFLTIHDINEFLEKQGDDPIYADWRDLSDFSEIKIAVRKRVIGLVEYDETNFLEHSWEEYRDEKDDELKWRVKL